MDPLFQILSRLSIVIQRYCYSVGDLFHCCVAKTRTRLLNSDLVVPETYWFPYSYVDGSVHVSFILNITLPLQKIRVASICAPKAFVLPKRLCSQSVCALNAFVFQKRLCSQCVLTLSEPYLLLSRHDI